jgi:hypothetical protein
MQKAGVLCMSKKNFYVVFISAIILAQPFFDIWTYWLLRLGLPNIAAYVRAGLILLLFLAVLVKCRFDWRILLVSCIYFTFILSRFLIDGKMGTAIALEEVEKAFKVFLMPLTMLWFIWYARDLEKETIAAIWRSLALVTIICFVAALMALATGTDLKTYSKWWIKIGLNGWFYSSNSQSIILYATIPFFLAWLVRNGNKLLFLAGTVAAWILLYFNGTRVAYLGLFAACGTVLAILIVRQYVFKSERCHWLIYSFLTLAIVLSVLLYPMSVTYLMYNNRAAAIDRKDGTSQTWETNGTSQTWETNDTQPAGETSSQKPADPDPTSDDSIRFWLNHYMNTKNINPVLARELYEVLQAASARQLIDKRFIQRTFVSVTIRNSDLFRYLFGYGSNWYNRYVDDLESDYAAIIGFYGLIGLFLYFMPIAWVLMLILRRILLLPVHRILTFEVLIPAMVSLSLFGVALLAGRALQQASTSIYLSVSLALFFLTTDTAGHAMPIRQNLTDDSEESETEDESYHEQ